MMHSLRIEMKKFISNLIASSSPVFTTEFTGNRRVRRDSSSLVMSFIEGRVKSGLYLPLAVNVSIYLFKWSSRFIAKRLLQV